MSVQVENLEKNMAKLTIEVAAEKVEDAIQAAYMKEKGKISVPGFRKGKVPRQRHLHSRSRRTARRKTKSV